MVAEKRIYSTTALQNCYRALRSARWSVRRKDEHMTRCCEVRELYAKCQVNLGCVLFDPDMSPAKDYLDMVKDKKVTKRRLDINSFHTFYGIRFARACNRKIKKLPNRSWTAYV